MDPDGSHLFINILLFALCLFISGFFSIAETSMTAMNKIRMRNLADGGNVAAKRVMKLLEHPENLISSMLVGNNIANISASALSTAFVIRVFGDGPGTGEWAVSIATGVVTLLVLIFSEITPKNLAVRHSESIARAISIPAQFFVALFTPVVYVLNKISKLLLWATGSSKRAAEPVITEEDFMTLVNIGHEQGVLENEERHMINNVVEFGEGMVREIMTPRINVVLVDIEWSHEEILEVFREHRFTRVPVYRESPDEIVGILNLKDLLLENVNGTTFSMENLEKLLRPANFVYEFNNISKVFAQMRRERVGMSVVVDEYGILAGIVTMEDVIEEIVGEITDEYDEEKEELIHKVGEEFLLDGSLSIDGFNEAVGTDIESDEFESIGGYLLGLTSELPGEGVTIYDGGLAFTIEKTDANRIETIRVRYEQEPLRMPEKEEERA